MREPDVGDMICWRHREPGTKPKTILGLLHAWNGNPDSHCQVIDTNLKRYRIYVDSATVVYGYEAAQLTIETALRVTKRGKKVAADEPPTRRRRGVELEPIAVKRSERPTKRGALMPHDVPERIADQPDELEGDVVMRGLNRDLGRYVDQGHRQRRYIAERRDQWPRYYREVILPNAHGPRQKADIQRLVAHVLKQEVNT